MIDSITSLSSFSLLPYKPHNVIAGVENVLTFDTHTGLSNIRIDILLYFCEHIFACVGSSWDKPLIMIAGVQNVLTFDTHTDLSNVRIDIFLYFCEHTLACDGLVLR